MEDMILKQDYSFDYYTKLNILIAEMSGVFLFFFT